MINLRPLITETTINLAKKNWFTFKSPLGENKNKLKEIIEEAFKVEVVDIKTLVVKGKSKKSLKTRRTSKGSDWKKVIVKLKEGQKIDLFEAGA